MGLRILTYINTLSFCGGLSCIRRMYGVPNARIRELWEVTKGVDERLYESFPRRFGHIERIGRERIAKRAYVGECMCGKSFGRVTVDWLSEGVHEKKGNLDIEQEGEWCRNRNAFDEMQQLWVVTAKGSP